MSRKLATVTKIKDILPIPDADNIVAVTMTTNNWVCVVQKDTIQEGDWVVYFEADSFIDTKDERFKFLDGKVNKTYNEVEGYRLKTVTLRGQVSQGLVLPFANFPELEGQQIEGRDVTNVLNIQPYDSSLIPDDIYKMSDVGLFSFPSRIPKTSQRRIQSFTDAEIEELRHFSYEVTGKMEGASCTMYYDRGHFGVCSRNEEIMLPDAPLLKSIYNSIIGTLWPHCRVQDSTSKSVPFYWKVAKAYAMEERLRTYCKRKNRNLAIQGEICGPGIRCNRCRDSYLLFYIFDMYDIDTESYIPTEERCGIFDELCALGESIPSVQGSPYLSLHHVPELWLHFERPYKPPKEYVEELLRRADEMYASGKVQSGLVLKGLDVPDVSFKVVSNKYLLEREE
jgi:RNA ligase (TIGR02306 family)